jgi:hypothetical protein
LSAMCTIYGRLVSVKHEAVKVDRLPVYTIVYTEQLSDSCLIDVNHSINNICEIDW